MQDRLVEKGLRIEVDDSANSMQKKIRENARQKIPLPAQSATGKRSRVRSTRRRGEKQQEALDVEEFAERVLREVASREETLWTRAAGEEYNCWCSVGARVRSTPKRNQSLGGLLAPKFAFERSGAQ